LVLRSMVDSEQVTAILREHLRFPVGDLAISRLQGDASNRTYYRLRSSPNRTLILMVLSEPEAFKASEEKVTGSGEIDELPFLNVQRHLRAHGVPVPEVYYMDPSRGWLFLEDLGETTFAERVLPAPEESRVRYYRTAIDTLVTMQQRASEPDALCIAFGRAFDVPLLMWEFEHFLEYEIEKRRGIVLPDSVRKEVHSCFLGVSEALALEPRAFTHRDFHSRNLMLQPNGSGERLCVIDFQDALMGPPQYDLASLLRDSYISLEEKSIDDLIAYYLEHRAPADPMRREPARFRELFDLASLQRNFKAAGRFAYIDLVKKNGRYLAYISPMLKRVKRSLERQPRLSRLFRALESYLPEFQGP